MFTSKSGLTWESIKWAFLNPVAGNWHPLTVLSHMVDCQLFGLKPWGHHLTNVLLHALNAGLVFVLLQQMTGASVAESVGGGVVRRSPAARRIGRLGGGTQGCAQRLLRSARADGLRPLRAKCRVQKCRMQKSSESKRTRSPQRAHVSHLSTFHLLSSLPVLLRPGLDEQADAGDVAVRDVAAGLLAAGRMQNAECGMQSLSATRTRAKAAPCLGRRWFGKRSRSLSSRRWRAS